MDRDDILDGTARRAGLESQTDAERAVLSTLTTFGEHVSAGESEDLAEQLPEDLAGAVTSETDESPETFGVDEFAGRVASREGELGEPSERASGETESREGDGVDPDEAVVHVRAVMATLADQGLHNELQEAREQLPNEFASLFDTDELQGE